MTNKCNKKWKSLSAFGDWKKGVPKGKVGLIMGCGGRLPNGRYPKLIRQIIVPANITRYGRKYVEGTFSKFKLTDKEILQFTQKRFYP